MSEPFITHLVADAFGTKCFITATGVGEECVVVDPGIGVLDQLHECLRRNRLRPVAVLVTHGHLDHSFSITPLAAARGIPAFVHPGDRHMLADPFSGLGSLFTPQFEAAIGPDWRWTEPDDVRALEDGTAVELAGLKFCVDHVPGHTPGSVMFGLATDSTQYCFVGDTMYAGTIGRTDMPGGSRPDMLTSLRTRVLPMADETVLLTGHGPDTTVGAERYTNPFLLQAKAMQQATAATPARP